MDLIPNWLFITFFICVVILVIGLIRDKINFMQFLLLVVILMSLTIGYVKLNPDKKDNIQEEFNKIQKSLTSGTPLENN